MTCEHLRAVEQAMIGLGIRQTFRGKAWSRNCREWVYFDCYIDLETVRDRFSLGECVQNHIHRGTHDGQERGLVCSICHDAIMGAYEERPTSIVFPGARD
jgi:hypothetical protein